MTMTPLSLDRVSRRFGGLQAVQDVSLTVRPGTITGLIGPNGAGKSTVVNLVTGLLKLSAGAVTFEGEDISRLPPRSVARRGIARTFQNINLLPEASVLENVMAGAYQHDETRFFDRLFGLPAVGRQDAMRREEAAALLRDFGMADLADQEASQLSYGHQRRVEIMRALAMRPRILLLDEPVAGMNDVEAADLGRHVRQVAQSGIGVLLIEHNMTFVMELCSHIYVLSSGRLIAEGGPDEVRRDPAVIEAYLGS